MSGRKEKTISEKQSEKELKKIFSTQLKRACQKKFQIDREIGTEELFKIFKYIYPEEANLYQEDKNSAVRGMRKWFNESCIPSYQTLIKLCSFLDCSIDYLFNRIPLTTHDRNFIHQYLGLSESSIKKIENENNQFLEMLISSEGFYDLDYTFGQLQNSMKWFMSCYSYVQSAMQEMNLSEKDYKNISEISSSASKWSLEVNSNIYQLGLLFGNILNAYKENITNKAPDTI